ncbi:TRAP transporter fused permease subunit [Fulvimarina sp. MAC3]|uniref:TRAP transporter permease n=1 Tax=Fulvimarina sp. MAC3 TaxID=3148887 RepID=UPI0031FDD2BE
MTTYDEDYSDPKMRRFDGLFGAFLSVLAVFIALAHMALALFPFLSELERNIFHFASFAFLCAVYYPAFLALKNSRFAIILDISLGIAVAAACLHLALSVDAIYARGVRLLPVDWIAAVIAILGAIELTRRAAGIVIPILIILAISYVTIWGSWISGVFAFPGLSWETTLFRSIYGDDALFGTIARISSTYVFLFIIFGAFLIKSGAGDFVIDLAKAAAGKLVGGPGLVAVIASGLTGTISGSAIANTASTGVITIPLMKRAGFKSKFAAGVEAASSTGGQLMPPIMGAGAFVMASLTQISYEYIILVAALPALLYFLSVCFFVRIEAKRLNLPPMGDGEQSLTKAVKEGGASFIIPIVVLIGLLASGFTPTYAAVIGIVAVIASSWLTTRPMGPRQIWEALEFGTRNMITSAVLLCAVGLVVNVIATAGVGNTFSLMITNWSGGVLLIAIILIALASLVLGMGLPVTAAYIVLATLSAPALAGMIQDLWMVDMIAAGNFPDSAVPIVMLGAPEAASQLGSAMSYGAAQDLVASLPLAVSEQLRNMLVPATVATTALLSAHMIVFWLSQDSNVTPPVCLAAFTAAAIAKSPPMATGVASWKLAKGLYIVPVLFAYTPLLSGDWGQALTIFAFAVFGIYALAAALQGCMESRLNIGLRLLAGAAGIACLWPFSVIVNIIGVIATVAILAYNVSNSKPGTLVAAS